MVVEELDTRLELNRLLAAVYVHLINSLSRHSLACRVSGAGYATQSTSAAENDITQDKGNLARSCTACISIAPCCAVLGKLRNRFRFDGFCGASAAAACRR